MSQIFFVTGRLRWFLLLIFSTFLLSCAGLNTTDSMVLSSRHIIANCRIFDISGNLLRSVPGHLCHFENDGTTVSMVGNTFTKFSPDFKPLWSLQAVLPHHQLKRAKFSGNYLLLDSSISKRGKKNFRSDVLKIISPEGKVLRSVNFKTVLRLLHDRKMAIRPHMRAFWMDSIFSPDIDGFEESHVNSFYEYFEVRDGKEEFAGYVVNCYYQKKIVFLDKELAKVTAVIDVGTRAIHDVQMKDPGKLFFYQNYFSPDVFPRFSSLSEYDLQTGRFSELYSAKSPEFSSRACGSVQHLGESRYMLAHSNCSLTEDAAAEPVLEVIDLRRSERSIVRFAKGTKMGFAEIVDLSGYLKKNAGM